MANDSNKASIGLFARVLECDDKPASMSDVLNLSIRDRSEMRNKIDEKEGEFDDEVKFSCPFCKNEYTNNLQLDGPSFFSL
jgi:hypothetical protein